MTGVRTVTVAAADEGLRLDRWFRQHFPGIGHGQLEKLLRTGQIRVDGGRVRSGHRLARGQAVRVPPAAAAGQGPPDDGNGCRKRAPLSADVAARLAADLAARVCHMDDEVLALDKPAGLAVQGGTGVGRHVDAALDGLRFGATERPRLVHRLDRDTSGVLLLARTARAARWLTGAFRDRSAEKIYWCIVCGEPGPDRGRVTAPLARRPGAGGEKVRVDQPGGRRAVTDYQVVEQLGRRAAWVALRPKTGRTHQLRVHMTSLGTPILGDGKYGGRNAFIDSEGLARRLHLHARSVRLVRPDGGRLLVTAPLPPHMAGAWNLFGFSRADPVLAWPED